MVPVCVILWLGSEMRIVLRGLGLGLGRALGVGAGLCVTVSSK
jgi:hypothetical protein